MKQEMKQEMKREILFRGKRTFCNEWVFGDLGHYPDRTKIDTHENGQPWRGYDVFPETVGQFTGLTDKNGDKIFEGDIVAIIGRKCIQHSVVKYYRGSLYVDFQDHPGYGKRKVPLYDFTNNVSFVVIGNIHDNPELLEGGVEK